MTRQFVDMDDKDNETEIISIILLRLLFAGV